MKLMMAIGLGSLCMVWSGCGARDHIREDFGQQTHEFFSRQQISKAPTKGNPLGLDSEEAAIIHDSYRKSIGGSVQSNPQDSSRVLLLEGKEHGKQKK